MVETSNKMMISKIVNTLYTSKYFENMTINIDFPVFVVFFLNNYVK